MVFLLESAEEVVIFSQAWKYFRKSGYCDLEERHIDLPGGDVVLRGCE
jgi:hypothetical protein